jgi:hypothetical protein
MSNQNLSISNFKLFCIKFLLPFFLLFFLIGYTFQYLFEKNVILKSEINGSYKINRIINETHKDEIPMFGSSRMEGDLIPGILGPRYFNYGLTGTQDDVVLLFLGEEVKKNKTSSIIINFDIDGLNYSSGDVANYLYNIDNKNVQQVLGSNDDLHYHIPIIKYYGFYEGYLKDYLSNRIALTKFTDKGASIEKNTLLPQVFNQAVTLRKNYSTTFKNDTLLKKRLDDILSNHPEREFIFVIAPYHSSNFTKFTNEKQAAQYFSYLKTYKNVRVLDFSRANFPDSLFFDTQHLNYKGAVRFTKTMKDTLAKL